MFGVCEAGDSTCHLFRLSLREGVSSFMPAACSRNAGRTRGARFRGESVSRRRSADRSSFIAKVLGRCSAHGTTHTSDRDIARLAANYITQKLPSLARACHAETFLVPHSTMARWVKGAEKTLMIDGCFLKCHGRVLKKLVGEEKVIHIDALPLYKKYTDIFLMDDVPEEERKAVALDVAKKILAKLQQESARA